MQQKNYSKNMFNNIISQNISIHIIIYNEIFLRLNSPKDACFKILFPFPKLFLYIQAISPKAITPQKPFKFTGKGNL